MPLRDIFCLTILFLPSRRKRTSVRSGTRGTRITGLWWFEQSLSVLLKLLVSASASLFGGPAAVFLLRVYRICLGLASFMQHL